jgi:hypothetical protein
MSTAEAANWFFGLLELSNSIRWAIMNYGAGWMISTVRFRRGFKVVFDRDLDAVENYKNHSLSRSV